MQGVSHVTQGQPLQPYPTHTRHDLASSLMPGGNTSASVHPLHAVAHSPSVSEVRTSVTHPGPRSAAPSSPSLIVQISSALYDLALARGACIGSQ